jgi:hypothetical protein
MRDASVRAIHEPLLTLTLFAGTNRGRRSMESLSLRRYKPYQVPRVEAEPLSASAEAPPVNVGNFYLIFLDSVKKKIH